MDKGGYEEGLRYLIARNMDVYVIQVLSQEEIDPPMTVKYAPAELTLVKGAQFAEVAIPGLELPVLQFIRGDATTLSMDLFFDSTEGGTGTSTCSTTSTG